VKRLPVPRPLDLAVSAGVAVIAVAEVATNPRIRPTSGALAVELALAVAVAWRRSAPLVASAAVAIGVVADAAIGVQPSDAAVPPVACVIVLYSLVSYVDLRRALVGSGLLLLGATGQVIVGHQSLANLFFVYGLLGFAWAFGRMVRLRTTQAVAAELAVVELHRERDEERRRIAEEERARIARELHDVVAHSVSVMVVQAGAAQQVLERDPNAANSALAAVQDTGRQAVAELARMLGILRGPMGESADLGLAPMPTLAELPDLVRTVDRTGPRVTLTVHGRSRPLSSSLELTVYRIVQEALTNTCKHAGPQSTAAVTLAYCADSLELEVVDDGAGTALPSIGTGHGLVGIQERVGSHHGNVTFGASAGHGFRVKASFPLEGSP
jgi:signal transduction histidine kinase